MTRSSSRRLYGDVLEAGAKIYEYQPSMIHAKILIIDGVWSVVGSTNFDSRSFAINDEVNLAVLDPMLAARLTQRLPKGRPKARKSPSSNGNIGPTSSARTSGSSRFSNASSDRPHGVKDSSLAVAPSFSIVSAGST